MRTFVGFRTRDVDVSPYCPSVPGATLRVRSKTVAAQDRLTAWALANADPADGDKPRIDAEHERIKAEIVALCLVDADGGPLLGPEERAVVLTWSAALVDALYTAIQELSLQATAAAEADVKN